MKTFTYEACDESATSRLGEALSAALPDGTVIALCGTLGSGKTRLTQALAVAEGRLYEIEDRVFREKVPAFRGDAPAALAEGRPPSSATCAATSPPSGSASGAKWYRAMREA